jgi:hypothetical protein
MTTKNRILIACVVCVVVLLGIVAQMTKPSVPTEKAQTEQSDAALLKAPLDVKQIHHMRDAEKIDFGPDTTHAIAIWPDQGKIHIVVSEKMMQEHGGAELLSKLSLQERDCLLTPAQYQRFLARLHDALGDDNHDHEHDEHRNP